MLANWMLYCVAVGTLLAGGALALERGIRSLGRPTRWVWAGAMALTLAVPVAVRLRPAPRGAPGPTVLAPSALRMVRVPAPAAVKAPARRLAPPPLRLGGWDPALRLAWGASSAAVLLALAAMGVVLARRRRRWAAAEVDGVPVLVSPDVGPAVVGLFRSRIVLPAWALAAEGEARRLVLEHEREHVRAGDPRLLAAAIVCAALTPWNLAVWWQLRRLRLAVEVDCDARVLRRRADVRAYGTVLLEMGRRASRSRLPVAAFAEPVSSLERRIRIMTAPRASRPLLRASGFGGLAAALVALACEAPQPTQPSPAAGDRSSTLLGYQLAWDDTTVLGTGLSLPKTALTPAAAVARYFPEVARQGTAPDDILHFVVSSDGEVLRHEWVRGTPDPGVPGRGLGDPRLQNTLREFRGTIAGGRLVRFRAGEVGPTATQVAWTQLRPPPGSADPRGRGSEHDQALDAAIRRHYPPLLRDAGITARVTVGFTVGADGKARGVKVVGDDVQPAFVEAARAVVADLTFPQTGPEEETVMVLVFAPERTPAPSAS